MTPVFYMALRNGRTILSVQSHAHGFDYQIDNGRGCNVDAKRIREVVADEKARYASARIICYDRAYTRIILECEP